MKFLGFRKIDFTDEKTKKHITGYQIFVGIPIEFNGEGLFPQKYFINNDLISQYIDNLSDYIDCPITLSFDYRGKVCDIKFYY